MNYDSIFSPILFSFLLFQQIFADTPTRFINVADRDIPVVEEVDLLVVGGDTASVIAAVEASRQGAKTLLITPRPYLGDDMAGTLRLWVDPEEKAAVTDPMVRSLYGDPIPTRPVQTSIDLVTNPNKLSYTYKIVEPIDPKHSEAKQGQTPRLYDGLAEIADSQSLQINGDATIIVDLQKEQPIGGIALLAFYSKRNYDVAAMNVYAGNDGETWKKVAENIKPQPLVPGSSMDMTLKLGLAKPISARFLKIVAVKQALAARVLLGELIIFPDKQDLNARSSQPEVDPKAPILIRPMHVKQFLDKALIDNGVKFYYGTFLSGLLENAETQKEQGVLISNRAGRQVVLAKKILFPPRADQEGGTKHSRNARAEFVVIGGEPQEVSPEKYPLLNKTTSTVIPTPYYGPWPNDAKTSSGEFRPILYQFEIDIKTAEEALSTIRSMSQLEQQIRLATFHPDQQATSDIISIRFDDTQDVKLEEKIQQARSLGKQVGTESKALPKVDTTGLQYVSMPYPPNGRPSLGSGGAKSGKTEANETVSGKLEEVLSGLKTFDNPEKTLTVKGEKIPVIGEYDVVVVGGGTSGVPAAIGAARGGAKTLVVELQHDLGGVGTSGAISIYCYGYRDGFTKQVEDGKGKWNIEQRIYWWRKTLADLGVDTWHGVLGGGVLLEDQLIDGRNNVKGVLVVTPSGPGIVLSRVLIDSTGNSDLAVTAGADTMFAAADRELAIQGAGLPPRDLGTSYTNTDYMFVDETDIRDATHVFVYGRQRFAKAFDLAKMLDTRERRRIVGETTFSVLDQINGRTYPDTIAHVFTNYDSHGIMSHRVLEFPYSYYDGHESYVPYRASLPKGVDGLLVSGLATSGDRDAMAVFRMQPDLQNQGYALGYIASIAVEFRQPLRQIDIRKAQKHLVEIGSLRAEVLEHEDNYETTKAELPEIVRTLPEHFDRSHRLLWHPAESIPLLKEALSKATDKDAKINYATVLAALDDPSGAEVLLEAVREFKEWDSGPQWKVRNTIHGFSVSERGRLILALGRTRDPRGVDAIAEKLKLLRPGFRWLHARTCIQALETIGGERAAAVLAETLDQPKTSGFVQTDWRQSTEGARYKSIIEISLARALYRCGDTPDGKGRKILEAYTKDIRGVFSRHAVQVLESREKKSSIK